MKFYLCILCYFLMLCHESVNGNEISFLKYCVNESNPEPFPTSGEHSSGALVMNVNPGSEPWYQPDLNCSLTFTTESNFHILLTFSNISLRNASMDNLTVFYNSDASDLVLAGQQVCSNENCEGLKFDSGNFNNLTLKFISANATVPKNVTGFQGRYTVFNYVEGNGACHGSNRFLCENKHCIWYDLVCDGHNNCGDNTDETKCIIPVKDTVWGIVIIVLAVLCILFFVPMFFFLAIYGTRTMVKSVVVPNQPTPLLSAVGGGENSGLLTSSEAMTNCWPGTSYDSVGYGSAQPTEPIVDTHVPKKQPSTSTAHSQDL